MKTQLPNILTFCVRDNFNSHDNFVVSFACEDKTDLMIQLQQFHLFGFENPSDIDRIENAAEQIHHAITDIQKRMESKDRHLIWMKTNGDKNTAHGASTHISSDIDLTKNIFESLQFHYGKMPKDLIAADDSHFKKIARVIPTLKVGSKSCFHLNPPKETR
jgi:hypothetical protein